MKFFKSLFAPANLFIINSASAKAFTEGWPQIKTYYEILSQDFHASERGILEDIKSDSWILVEKAEELSIEGMPAEYRNPKILETLLTLKKQTQLVNDFVQHQAPDNDIRVALSKLYDIFHHIVELCLSKK